MIAVGTRVRLAASDDWWTVLEISGSFAVFVSDAGQSTLENVSHVTGTETSYAATMRNVARIEREILATDHLHTETWTVTHADGTTTPYTGESS